MAAKGVREQKEKRRKKRKRGELKNEAIRTKDTEEKENNKKELPKAAPAQEKETQARRKQMDARKDWKAHLALVNYK